MVDNRHTSMNFVIKKALANAEGFMINQGYVYRKATIQDGVCKYKQIKVNGVLYWPVYDNDKHLHTSMQFSDLTQSRK